MGSKGKRYNVMKENTIFYYGFELPLKKMEKEEQKKLLKGFFDQGLLWIREGYKLYCWTVSGEGRAGLWSAAREEVLSFAKEAERFSYFAGPLFSIDKEKRHPLVEILSHRDIYKNTTIWSYETRRIFHKTLMIATKEKMDDFKKALLLIERPHSMADLDKPREKRVLLYPSFSSPEEKREFLCVSEDYRVLFLNILEEFQDEEREPPIAKRTEALDELLGFSDEEIKALVEIFKEKGVKNFNYVSAEDIKKIPREKIIKTKLGG